jgi:parallel beta-helix repeat protein
LFQYNTIDSTGYIGIDFRAGNISIKNNHITNFCLRKDDGAAIYTWGNTQGHNIVEDNIIENGIGTGEGSANSNQLFASGIYIDDRSSHVQVKGNTVSHCATAGIFLHNARFITVANNILTGNGSSIANKEKGQLYIKLDTLGKRGDDTALHLSVSYNLFIVERDAAYCVYLSSEKNEDLYQLGTFNLNQ